MELLQCDRNDLRVLAKDIEESGSVEENSSEEDNDLLADPVTAKYLEQRNVHLSGDLNFSL